MDLDSDGDLDAIVGDYDGVLSYFTNIGAPGAPVFEESASAANPFSGLDVGYTCSPDLVDLDSDGDLDAVVGGDSGSLRYFENAGSSDAPEFVEASGSTNPFSGIDVVRYSSPELVDLDDDGDFDAVVGSGVPYSNLRYFENTGSSHAPVFIEVTGAANPFSDLFVGESFSSPELVDLDGDGDLDAIVGNTLPVYEVPHLLYFENTGSSDAPDFLRLYGDANPFAGIHTGDKSTPKLVDLDGDGDLDAVVGQDSGGLLYLENTGSSEAPTFVEATGGAHHFSGIDVGRDSSPELVDIDGDGDLDLLVGEYGGHLAYFRSLATCVAGPETACLLGGRFQVNGSMRDFSSPPVDFPVEVMSFANGRAESNQAASFQSFNDGNFEIGVKMVDACGLPAGNALRAYWLFFGGLTNAETEVNVEDTVTGQIYRWFHPAGLLAQTIGDTGAFPCSPGLSVIPCTSDAETACLLSERFKVTGVMEDFEQPPNEFPITVMELAGGRAETDQAAFFQSFENGNFEIGVKMVDACTLPGESPLRAFWLFFGGLTNAATDMRVLDTVTGQEYRWTNEGGIFPQSIGDTRAFACDDS